MSFAYSDPVGPELYIEIWAKKDPFYSFKSPIVQTSSLRASNDMSDNNILFCPGIIAKVAIQAFELEKTPLITVLNKTFTQNYQKLDNFVKLKSVICWQKVEMC